MLTKPGGSQLELTLLLRGHLAMSWNTSVYHSWNSTDIQFVEPRDDTQNSTTHRTASFNKEGSGLTMSTVLKWRNHNSLPWLINNTSNIFPAVLLGKLLKNVLPQEKLKSESCPDMSDALWLPGLLPARLLCPWNFPGKKTRVGSHFLPQKIFPTQGSNLGLLHCRQILYHLSQQGSP